MSPSQIAHVGCGTLSVQSPRLKFFSNRWIVFSRPAKFHLVVSNGALCGMRVAMSAGIAVKVKMPSRMLYQSAVVCAKMYSPPILKSCFSRCQVRS